tara:strand:- start:209 stop:925 length:717 start_codon:yes stop_codon:yes gene_type:complete
MAEKFSQFTSESTLADITGLAGYITGSPGTNVRISGNDVISAILPVNLASGSTDITGVLSANNGGVGAAGLTEGNLVVGEGFGNPLGTVASKGKGTLVVGRSLGPVDLTGAIPVGTDGHVLTANSAVSEYGVEWAAPTGGGGGLTPTTQTTNYTAAASDFVICNVTTSLRVTLPAASAGAVVGIKYASQSAPTDVCDILTPSAGVTIDGTDRSSTALVLPSLNTYYELISDGTNWFIK